MTIIFDSKEVLSISDKELFDIWKKLKKATYIYMNIVTILTIFIFIVYVFSLLYVWNCLFIAYAALLVCIFLLYKIVPVKFKDILLKMPNYQFEDEHFYIGEKQFNYFDIEAFEMGGSFARIKMGRYKLVLIFKGRDKVEMDMLVAKLKANAKRYKEV